MTRTFATMIIFGLFSFLSCKSTTYDSPTEYPKKQIIFGSGGGFTGKVQTYTLLENGQLFHNNGLKNTTTEMERVDKTTTKALFEQLEKADVANTNFNNPGNMYYFVKTKNGDKEGGATWSDNSGGGKGGAKSVPEACKNLYKELQAIVMKQMMGEDKSKQ